MTMHKISLLLACLACVGQGQETDSQKALASLLIGNNPAAAFNPGVAATAAQARSRSKAPVMAKSTSLPWLECPAHLEGMIGNAGFDPLGLSSPGNIKFMREAEIQHGRLCMLAWLGYVVVDLGIKFPGERYQVLTSFTAHDALVNKELFLTLLLVASCETQKMTQVLDMIMDGKDREPGDFGFDPLGLLTKETEERYKTAELIHGRAAMLAFSAVVTQSAIGHPNFPYF